MRRLRGGDRGRRGPSDVVGRFIDALAAGDTATACEVLSDEGRGNLAQTLAESPEASDCESVIASALPVSASEAADYEICDESKQEGYAYVDVVFGTRADPVEVAQFRADENADGSYGVDPNNVDPYGSEPSDTYICDE